MNEIIQVFEKKVKELIEFSNQIKDAESLDQAFGKFTEEVLKALEKKQLTREQGDHIFSRIDGEGLASSNPSKIEFSAGIRDLIFEGQILHDLGEQYGADIEMMKRIAKQLQE